GDGRTVIRGVGTLARAGTDQLSFLANPRYGTQLASTRAAAVVLTADQADASPVPVLVARDPYVAYARIAALFQPECTAPPGIHPSAVVASSARISDSASIGALCSIERDTVIGEGVIVGPHCVVGPGCT